MVTGRMRGPGMTLTIDASGMLKSLKNYDHLAPAAINKSNDLMARRAQARIRNVIRRLPYHGKQGGAHNTATSLQWSVAYKKSPAVGKTAPFEVFMRRRGRGINPRWVEFGVKPHPQPNNPIFREEGHPGAKPSHPFQRGMREFKDGGDWNELRKQLKKTMRNIGDKEKLGSNRVFSLAGLK